MFSKRTGTILSTILFVLSLTHLTYSQTWTQLSPTGSAPTTRAGHRGVYDSVSNRMTIYAGLNLSPYTILTDTWVLTNASGLGGTPSWIRLTTTFSIPTGRYNYSAVYDTTNNRMMIFGGYNTIYLNDVWVLNNANGLGGTSSWTKITTTGSAPTTRYYPTAIYDNTNNRMTIFGGQVSGGSTLNDAWVLSNANGLSGTPTWSELTISGNLPPGREWHTTVYDESNNRMVIYAGATSLSFPYINDVWVLSHANGLGGTPTWTQLTTSGNLTTGRGDHSAVYDSTNNRMIIFGGFTYTTSGSVDHNDVWVLSNANGLGGTPVWTQLSPTGSIPTTRNACNAIYDTANNRMTIFGGNNPSLSMNDVWVLDNADVVPVELSSFEAIKED